MSFFDKGKEAWTIEDHVFRGRVRCFGS